jgi:hypothetical protein
MLLMVDSLIKGNATIQSLASSSTKPTFLFWDKVYHKLVNADDEMWLLRACEAALFYLETDLAENEPLR